MIERHDDEGTRVAKKSDLIMGSDGIGFLDYFSDSWLFGRSFFNIIKLDYNDSIVAYGCDSYFWIFHYEYFWVLNKRPWVSYSDQFYYMNYIKTKFPTYANNLPVYFQGE